MLQAALAIRRLNLIHFGLIGGPQLVAVWAGCYVLDLRPGRAFRLSVSRLSTSEAKALRKGVVVLAAWIAISRRPVVAASYCMDGRRERFISICRLNFGPKVTRKFIGLRSKIAEFVPSLGRLAGRHRDVDAFCLIGESVLGRSK